LPPIPRLLPAGWQLQSRLNPKSDQYPAPRIVSKASHQSHVSRHPEAEGDRTRSDASQPVWTSATLGAGAGLVFALGIALSRIGVRSIAVRVGRPQFRHQE